MKVERKYKPKGIYHIAVRSYNNWMLTIQAFKTKTKAREFAQWNYREQSKEGKDYIIVFILNGEYKSIDFESFKIDWKS